jgi:hypothetical protein
MAFPQPYKRQAPRKPIASQAFLRPLEQTGFRSSIHSLGTRLGFAA